MHLRTAAAVAAMSLILVPAAAADTTTPSTLTVDGQGSVFITPDVAALSLTVNKTRPTSSQALSAANQRVDAIVRVIRALGVPASGIQTESIDVSPGGVRIGPKGHKHFVRRFTASESLSVTTTTSLVGPVIDAATHAGSSTIDGPDFSFSDPSAGMIAATNAALADASRRAAAAAATLGYTISGVQSVDLDPGENNIAPGTPVKAPAPVATTKPTTPTTVNPGTEEVDATVEVVYTIAPA